MTLHCFHTVYHEDGISVLGIDRSQKESYDYQENMGEEKGFQIHIQLQQSRQLVTCGQEHCPARAEHCELVFLASFLRFPGVAGIICTIYCATLLEIINHDHPLIIPKD